MFSSAMQLFRWKGWEYPAEGVNLDGGAVWRGLMFEAEGLTQPGFLSILLFPFSFSSTTLSPSPAHIHDLCLCVPGPGTSAWPASLALAGFSDWSPPMDPVLPSADLKPCTAGFSGCSKDPRSCVSSLCKSALLAHAYKDFTEGSTARHRGIGYGRRASIHNQGNRCVINEMSHNL